jgi:hypothetical protein
MFRHDHDLPKYDPNRRDRSNVTLQEAALRLQISHTAVRHMIEDGLLTATQVVSGAPWLITPERALQFLGGTPTHILCDNPKTIVIERHAYGEGLHQYNSALSLYDRAAKEIAA